VLPLFSLFICDEDLQDTKKREGDTKMPKFYVRWRMNPKVPIATEDELNKTVLQMLEGAKSELQAGSMKDWGICVDGSGGYFIYEVPDEARLFEYIGKYRPYVDLEARQVLTIEQAIESRKQASSKTGKQT
jgi:hypothetical protein